MESIINDWLSECADLKPEEFSAFANQLSQEDEIIQAMYLLFEDRTKYSQLLEIVCNQLFSFYRSQEIQLQRYTLQFLPTLIYIYLNAAAHGDIKNCRTVETLLLGIYNLELVDKNGESKAVSFRLPSLAMMSIYHEPSSLAPASLTESAVRRFEECNSKLVSWGPLKHVETLNAQNRLQVMTALLFVYNQQLGFIKKSAMEQLCRVASKLVTQGFIKHQQRSSYGSDSSFIPKLLPRIPVSSQFLLEFLHAIYYAMHNNCWYAAVQAVDDLHGRGCYEMYPDVMLVTRAIRDIAKNGPTEQIADSSGISVSSASSTTIVKSMITNASFRTKKLPDDLDEMLFENGEVKTAETEKPQPQTMPVPGSKRRAWLWKNPLHNSFDDTDIAEAKAGISTPAETSRRESVCSGQGSPAKSSPKKNRDSKGKNKIDKDNIQDQGDNKHKVKRDSIKDSIREKLEMQSIAQDNVRQSASQRLYRVLEEKALGEPISGSPDSNRKKKDKSSGASSNNSSNNRFSY